MLLFDHDGSESCCWIIMIKHHAAIWMTHVKEDETTSALVLWFRMSLSSRHLSRVSVLGT